MRPLLSKKKDEAAAKVDLNNITALAVEADRKAAAETEKIKTTQQAKAKALAVSQAEKKWMKHWQRQTYLTQ